LNRQLNVEDFRSPTTIERDLITALTSADFLGRSEVWAQLQSCHVHTIDDEGSLEIRTFCDRQALVRYRVCTELYGPDLDGTQISVMLHVLDGFCREIEIYKVDGSPIQRTPDTWEFFVLGPEWHSGSSA
jgi:hypothetical protein